MNSHLIGLVTVFALLLWMTVTWKGGALLLREIRSSHELGRLAEGVVVVMGFSGNLLNIGYELGRRSWNWPDWSWGFPAVIRLFGLALFLFGFGLVTWARRILGRDWTAIIKNPEARLHTEGPYGLVRHPIYTGCVILYAGLLLAQANGTGGLVFGAHMMGYLMKIGFEDRFLSRELDPAYEEYRRRAKWRMIPGIW